MPLTHILEFSRDPLSDTTPTWTDISAYLLEVPDCTLGVDGDLADPQPGGATFRLDNRDRRFEPEYAAGAYSPDIVPLRRMRWKINDGTTTFDVFYGFVVDWGPSWPGGMNQEALVKCVDGFELLTLDALDLLDPPSASTYEEVVMHDEPFGYWPLNDARSSTAVAAAVGPEGTVPLGKRPKRKRKRKGIPAPAGVVKVRANVAFGEPGLIVGDTGTSVKLTHSGSSSGHISVPMSATEYMADGKEITVEAWVKPTQTASNRWVAWGPQAASLATWHFGISSGGDPFFDVTVAPSTSISAAAGAGAIVANTVYHLVGTHANGLTSLYINGVLAATATGPAGALITPTSGSPILIGYNPGGPFGFDGWIDEFAVYEVALTAERVAAHYAAGSSGFPEQTAGERVAAVVISDLWAETDIQTGAHMVEPAMQHGQSRLDEIREAVKAELGLFYFKGTGDPRYLGWDYRGAVPYNSTAATFGNQSSEVPFEDITVAYDDEIFNEVTVTHQTAVDGEASHTMTDAASDGEFYRRAMPPYDTILVHHNDAEAVASSILNDHSRPQRRIDSLTLSSLDAAAQTQILTRLPGDLIRVKHRPKGDTAIDQVTHIRGRKLQLNPGDGDRARVLECDWQLARGFNATDQAWRLSLVGYSELQTATVLG